MLKRFLQTQAAVIRASGNNQRNAVGIQLLPTFLSSQVFSDSVAAPASDASAKSNSIFEELSQKHLKEHDLLGKNVKDQEWESLSNFKLPKLVGQGNNIQNHFKVLGREQANSMMKSASLMQSCPIPTKPTSDEWLQQSGWTCYPTDGKPFSVPCLPSGEAIVFDVEVLYKVSPFPVLAVACSSTAWYVWISPSLLPSSDALNNTDPSSPAAVAEDLIEIGHGNEERLIIGHFIAYDRARIKEEYELQPSKFGFLDTLSLHSAVGGLSTQQRSKWQKFKKDKETEESELKSLLEDEEIDESEHDSDDTTTTTTDTVTEKKRKRDSLSILQKDALDFFNQIRTDQENQPTHATRWEQVGSINTLDRVAELHLGIGVDKSGRKDFDGTSMEVLQTKFTRLVDYCANDVEVTFKLFQAVYPKFLKKCPHPVSFAGMMHMGKSYLTTGDNWTQFIENAEKKCTEYRDEIEETLQDLTKAALSLQESGAYLDDPWLKNLDWSVKQVRMTKETVSKKGVVKPARPYASANMELVGKPQWYRDLWDTKLKRIRLSTAKKVVPYLLKLEWKGHPILFRPTFGWMYHGPIDKVESVPDTLPIPPQDFMEPGHIYYRIPHPSGDGKNVGNPLSKLFSVAFDHHILRSEYPQAQKMLKLNSYCIYWISARARIMSQFVVWRKGGSGEKMGVIIPQTAPMGTVTRRATDATWMTASNAKLSRIGSELKAQIKAPDGYKFVGADVDSEELWIASLIGDSQFGIHGATAIGFMTLQGTKALGTDLHSTSGRIVGISRDTAKIFNYSRIYGAGQNYAARLLVQHNPGLSKSAAQEKAASLYKQTKGLRFKDEKKTFGTDMFWYGGSESFMFNMLERIANDPDSRTPVLGCQIPDTLLAEYVHDMFKTSRINWVVQSSGVDYLHLLLVSMDYLMRRMGIEGRFLLSIHDEVRFMIKEEHVAKAALALQISNLWTRSLFASKLGISNLPLNAAFFSAVDIDHVMRKEVDMDCVTPSNTQPISPGESQTIYQVLDALRDPSGALPSELDLYGSELDSIQTESTTLADPSLSEEEDNWARTRSADFADKAELFIKAQMCASQSDVKKLLAPSSSTSTFRSKGSNKGTVSRISTND